MRRVLLHIFIAVAPLMLGAFVAMPLLADSAPSCHLSNRGSFATLQERMQDILQPLAPFYQKVTQSMTNLARIAERNAGLYSQGRCARAVKDDLLRAHIITAQERPRGNGWKVGVRLFAEGKVISVPVDPKTHLPLGCHSLYDVPPGTILTYKRIPGTAKPNQCASCGHIEIRTKDGFASDYRSEVPVTGVAGAGEGPPRRPTHFLVGAYIPLSGF